MTTIHKNLKSLFILVILSSVCFMTMNLAVAEEKADSPSFENKLSIIEERTMMLHMVMKQLSHTYGKAKEDHKFMVDNGMDAKDIERLERAFQKKIQKMISDAVTDIDKI